jgi:hypothetical protein
VFTYKNYKTKVINPHFGPKNIFHIAIRPALLHSIQIFDVASGKCKVDEISGTATEKF